MNDRIAFVELLLKQHVPIRLRFLMYLAKRHMAGPCAHRNGYGRVVRSLPAPLRREAQSLFTRLGALEREIVDITGGFWDLVMKACDGDLDRAFATDGEFSRFYDAARAADRAAQCSRDLEVDEVADG